MVVTRISPEFTVPIPDQFREKFAAGQQVAITTDEQGRLVVAPVDQIRSLLMETFGMWADRADTPRDGVEYVDEIRRGHRLDQMVSPSDETD